MKQSRILLIVAIVAVLLVLVAVGVLVVQEQQASASCSKSDARLVSMFGKISLPAGSFGSNLTLTVINTTCAPIVGITVTSVQPQIAGVANTSFVVFNRTDVSSASPLPAGQLGTGSIPVSGIASGQKYVLMVSVNFASGNPAQTETMELYPEA